MQIRTFQTYRVFIPYNPPVHPYRSRRGQTQRAASLIVRLETNSGLVGWGEGGGHLPIEVADLVIGQDPTQIEWFLQALADAGVAPYPRSAIEMACWDLIGQAAGYALCDLLGGRLRSEVELCACIGIREPTASAEAALMCLSQWGFTTLKTKAGREVEEDLAIARAIREAIGDRATLRPDANEGYSPADAERVLRGMAEIGGLQYFEDPCSGHEVEALARFRQTIAVPIAVNMAIFEGASVVPIAQAGAADVLMPDTASAGGIWPVKKVAAVAEAFGLPCVMHCSHDLGLKTAAVAHIVASTPNFILASDTTYHSLVADILATPFSIRNGRIPVPTGPGLGVQVDEEQLRKYQAAAA